MNDSYPLRCFFGFHKRGRVYLNAGSDRQFPGCVRCGIPMKPKEKK